VIRHRLGDWSGTEDSKTELASFVRPDHEPGSPTAMANELGLRSNCFDVDDFQAAVDGLAANGYGLVGGSTDAEWLPATYASFRHLRRTPAPPPTDRHARSCRGERA
jgi:hypothetical protein